MTIKRNYCMKCGWAGGALLVPQCPICGHVFTEEKQQIMVNAEPMQFIPPALFSPEQLEQIRAVMREELQAALSEEEEPAVVKPIQFDPEIEGQPSLTTELVHDGKLYKGVLYFVKDVE